MKETGEAGEGLSGAVEDRASEADRKQAAANRARLLGRGALNAAEVIEPQEGTEEARAPRRFESDEDARQYGRTEWGDTVASLSGEEQRALRIYTRELPKELRGLDQEIIDYREINGALRGRSGYSPEVRRDIAQIDAALEAHPTTEALMVTRATGVEHWDFDPAEAKGKVLEESSYTSTSLGRVAEGFENEPLIVELEVPPGTPALYLSGEASTYGESERELLLGRGLKWEVTSIYPDEVTGGWRATGRVLR